MIIWLWQMWTHILSNNTRKYIRYSGFQERCTSSRRGANSHYDSPWFISRHHQMPLISYFSISNNTTHIPGRLRPREEEEVTRQERICFGEHTLGGGDAEFSGWAKTWNHISRERARDYVLEKISQHVGYRQKRASARGESYLAPRCLKCEAFWTKLPVDGERFIMQIYKKRDTDEYKAIEN